MIGRTLLHYQVLEKLGEGGMGVVYKARDVRLNRFVVLKVLRSDSSGDQDSNRRFFQEAQAASALNHPNIITIHDMAVESGVAFIVMEYIGGKPLDALVEPNGLRVDEVLQYALQVADALSVAHAAGVIHRDLKPGNIMVLPNGHIKLLDFGLAKLTNAWQSSQSGTPYVATVEGSIVGTVSYMSPEQAMGKVLDARSDLFSFGTVLYEMLTGKRVFGHASPLISLTAVLRDKPAAPSTLNPAIPASLDALVMRCLEKQPEHRFQSAAELKAELTRIRSANQTPIRIVPQQPDSPLCAQGREALRQWTAESMARAKDCFERAIRTDRDHCAVYACMSEYYSTAGLLGLREPSDAMKKAEWAARKALELDSNCEQASVTLGIVTACFHFEWQQASTYFENLHTEDSRLRYALWYLRPLGRFAEAEARLQGNDLALGWIALERGDVEGAAGLAARSGQQHWLAAWMFAWALLERGLPKEAISMARRGLDLEPGQPFLEAVLASAFARDGDAGEARRILAERQGTPAWLAIPVCAALGDREAAFAAAQDAVRRRDSGVVSALRMPGTAVVRLGSRFAELIREMNLDRVQSAGSATG